MPGQMVSIPAIERRRDVYRPVHKGRVEGDRERKVSQRNVAKGKRQCERIERACGQPGNDQCSNQKTVAMDEREKQRGYGEKSRRKQEHAPWPQQPPEV